MIGYRFRARTPDGKVFKGVLQATSLEEAQRALAKQKLIPETVREEPLDRSLHLRRTPEPKALVQFARQFATLVESAIPLLLSLEMLQALTDDRPLRRALAEVTGDVRDGHTLADSLRKHPRVFSGIFVAIVDAGEQGGSLDTSLLRLADYMERAQVIRDRVQAAMLYPAFIASVAVGAVVALLVLVVPTFESMFAASGLELPYPTLVLVNSSRFIADQWPFLVVGVLFAVLVGKAVLDAPWGRRMADRTLLTLPGLRRLTIKVTVARVARTMGSLLGSGITILEASSAAARTAGNVMVDEALSRSRARIAGGSTIADALRVESLFPPMMAQMVDVGEQTGQLAEMFSKVADFYEREVDVAVDGLLKALEPAMVVVVGLILGAMVVAMYLPIFDAVGAVGP